MLSPKILLSVFTINEDDSLSVDFSSYIEIIDSDSFLITASETEFIDVNIIDDSVHFIPAEHWSGS